MPDEQARALEYRRMMIARAANKQALELALKGDATAYQRVYNAWAPLLPWEGWDGPAVADNEK